MRLYDVLLFAHISCATIWLGAAFLLQVQAAMALNSGDPQQIFAIMKSNDSLATRVFIPASLGALIFGIALVFEGGWGFDQLWVIIGLAGFAATFVVGVTVLKPAGARIRAIVERDGGLSGDALAAVRHTLAIGRVDLAVLYLVLANMVLKPSASDIGTLVAMISIFVVALVVILFFARVAGRGPAMVPAE